MPSGPVPASPARSMPRSLASLRTGGLASARAVGAAGSATARRSRTVLPRTDGAGPRIGGGLARAARRGRGLDAVADQDRLAFGLLGRGLVRPGAARLGAGPAAAAHRSRAREPRPRSAATGLGPLRRGPAAGHVHRDDRRAHVDRLALLGTAGGRPSRPTGEGSSTTALAVSISTMIWLTSTWSPGLTCQETMSASVRPSPTSGSLNSLSSAPSELEARGRRRPGSGPGWAGNGPRAGTAGTGWRSRRPAAPAPPGGRSTAR